MITTDLAPLEVAAEVARRFGLALDDLLAPGSSGPGPGSGTQRVRQARGCAYAVLRRTTDLSYPALGRVFGRHHTTIIQVVAHVESNPEQMVAVEEVLAALAALHADPPAQVVPPAPRSRDDTWRQRAACRGEDPDLFHAPAGGTMDPDQEATARAICATCPVREACLAWALDAGSDALGIAGGTDLNERRAMLGHTVVNPEKAERIALSAHLRSTGMDIRLIAAQVGVTPKSVHRYLAAAQPTSVAS